MKKRREHADCLHDMLDYSERAQSLVADLSFEAFFEDKPGLWLLSEPWRSSVRPPATFHYGSSSGGAFATTEEATNEPEPQSPPEVTGEEKQAATVALGGLGGKKGGPARAAKLTPEQRKEIAKKAAQARWQKPQS